MADMRLTDRLIHVPLSQVRKTKYRFWGENYYIHLYDYFLVLSFLYESGAILGRAMRSNLNLFEEMLPISELECGSSKVNLFGKMLAISDYQEVNLYNPSMKDLQEMSKGRLHRYRKRFRKEPDTFQEFIYERELQLAFGIHPADLLEATVRGNYKKAIKAYDKKIPVEQKWDLTWVPTKKENEFETRMFVLESIGFGSYFPELTEKLNRNYWESVRPEVDRLSHEFSKVKPFDSIVPKQSGFEQEELTILSFEEQEEAILRAVAFWAKTYYPELFGPLGLEGYYIGEDSERFFEFYKGYRYWFSLISHIDHFSWD